jgi:Methyltransferase domain/Glycosyltransferase family 9 (heptosyltransferase)
MDWIDIASEQAAMTPKRGALKVQFPHGLGDCANFAHQLPLYVRRGHKVTVVCTPDKHIVFADSGVEVSTEARGAPIVPWYEGLTPTHEAEWNNSWRWSKPARNISLAPMPNIGTAKDLWNEYCSVTLNVLSHLPPEACQAASRWLHALPRPIVLLHSHGNTNPERKNLEPQKCRRLYHRLLDATDGTIVLLDWDDRVPRIAHGRVRHLSDDWTRIDTSTLLALMSQSDLLIGVDSGPLHAARLMDIPAIGVWAHDGSPIAWSLPRSRQINVVMSRERPSWYARSRIPFHLIATTDDEPAMDQLALLAASMIGPPRYLDRAHLAADVQLQWFVRQRMRGGESALGGYVDRHRSFDLLLQQLGERFAHPRVVETGCIRAEDDFAGAGFSTYVLGAYLQHRGGHLTSVDNDANHCAFAQHWTRCFGAAVDVCVADSVAWLKGGSEPINLLYLDSLDTDQARCAEHGLAEIQAAYPRLRGRSLVTCDDTVYRGNAFHGKGALLVPWLLERGWRILYSGHQTILSQ